MIILNHFKDHLALMVETLGKINKTFAMSGNKSREFFNKNAQLINIKVLEKYYILGFKNDAD